MSLYIANGYSSKKILVVMTKINTNTKVKFEITNTLYKC